MQYTPEELSHAIAQAASSKKAKDIVILRMRELTTTTDFFIIASANTATQTRAIADAIEENLRNEGIEPLHIEGYREGEWILLDYGDCVAHIFLTESRDFYALEKLWGEAPSEMYEDEA